MLDLERVITCKIGSSMAGRFSLLQHHTPYHQAPWQAQGGPQVRHKKQHKLGMHKARLGGCLLGDVQQDAEQVTHIVVAVKVQRKHA